jgi:hypothetical protein
VSRAGSIALGALSLALSMAPAAARGGSEAPPRYAELPSGTPPALPTSEAPPARIPATERAEGFYPARPYGHDSRRGGEGQVRYAMVFGSEEMARSMTQGRGLGAAPDDRTCFLSPMNFGPRAGAGQPVQWIPSFQSMATVSVGAAGGTVQPVRAERFTPVADGRAELSVAHAWIDPSTLGARLISRGTQPFTRIATAPGGVELYAARAGDTLDVVVVNTAPQSVRSRVGGMVFQIPGGMAGSQSGCGHLRFTLPAARGTADMVSVQGDVVLDPGQTDPKRALIGSLVGVEPPETKVRTLRLGVSTSWSTRDPEPVLSVSMGWSGKERSF